MFSRPPELGKDYDIADKAIQCRLDTLHSTLFAVKLRVKGKRVKVRVLAFDKQSARKTARQYLIDQAWGLDKEPELF